MQYFCIHIHKQACPINFGLILKKDWKKMLCDISVCICSKHRGKFFMLQKTPFALSLWWISPLNRHVQSILGHTVYYYQLTSKPSSHYLLIFLVQNVDENQWETIYITSQYSLLAIISKLVKEFPEKTILILSPKIFHWQ